MVLSIVGIDQVPTGYYAGTLRQEALAEAGPVPWTILRATQFHEFPAQLLGRSRARSSRCRPARPRPWPPARWAVGGHLLALATGPARGHGPDLAGPAVHPLTAQVRQVMRALGHRGLVARSARRAGPGHGWPTARYYPQARAPAATRPLASG